MGELEELRTSIAQHRAWCCVPPTGHWRQGPGRALRVGTLPAKTVSVTISIGVAESNDKLKSPDEVLQAADKALYRAKEKGHNPIYFHLFRGTGSIGRRPPGLLLV